MVSSVEGLPATLNPCVQIERSSSDSVLGARAEPLKSGNPHAKQALSPLVVRLITGADSSLGERLVGFPLNSASRVLKGPPKQGPP